MEMLSAAVPARVEVVARKTMIQTHKGVGVR